MTTNGKFGYVDVIIVEKLQCTIFLTNIRRKYKLCIYLYTKHSSLIINLHERQAYCIFAHYHRHFFKLRPLPKNF